MEVHISDIGNHITTRHISVMSAWSNKYGQPLDTNHQEPYDDDTISATTCSKQKHFAAANEDSKIET